VKESMGKVLIIDNINRALLVINKDHSAKLYVNDFEETAKIKPSRDIKAGEAVFLSDISEIQAINFPGVDIQPTDRVVYLTRAGFIMGLYFNFTEEIEPEKLADELANLKKRIFFEDHLQKSKEVSFGFDALILTEGKTDIAHFKKALTELDLKPYLSLQFDETGEDFGDTNLLAACKSYARTPHDQPIICIFDRDNNQVIKELEAKTEAEKTYQSWGNNVYSLMLPIPSHRKNYKNISIEMYYSEEVIKQLDATGKRLYFDNEIKKEILPEQKPSFRIIAPVETAELTKRVFDTDAEKILNEKDEPCAISKTVFAEYISTGIIQTDFSAFHGLFEIIKDILQSKSVKA
jgi:RNA-directed DNA polymerase